MHVTAWRPGSGGWEDRFREVRLAAAYACVVVTASEHVRGKPWAGLERYDASYEATWTYRIHFHH